MAAAASANSNSKYDQALAKEGVNLILTNQFAKANEFNSRNATVDCKVALLHSLLSFGNAMGSYSQDDLTRALDSCTRSEEMGKKQEKSFSKDPYLHIEAQLVQADALLLRSLIQSVQEEYMRMMWNMRTSYNLYHAAQKEVSTYNGPYKDDLRGWAKYGVGLFNLVLSLMPPSMLSLATTLGFEGDKNKGLVMLNECKNSPSFMSPFSAILLCSYYLIIAQYTGDDDPNNLIEARKILDWSQEKYPNGAFFAYMESKYYRSLNQTRKAIEIADATVPLVKALPSIEVLFYYQKGWCAFFDLGWIECAETFDKLLHATPGGDYVPQNGARTTPAATTGVKPTPASAQALYAYQIGLCYAMVGDWHRADWYIRGVPSWLQKNPKLIEQWGKRKAAEYMSRTRRIKEDVELDICEMMQAWNGYTQMSKEKLGEAEAMLVAAQSAERKGSFKWSEEDNCRCILQLSAIRNALHRYAEANKDLTALIERSKTFIKSSQATKTGFKAFFYYELALSCYNLNQLEQAEQWQAKSAKVNGYDLENFVQPIAHGLKRKIAEKKQGKKK